MSLPPSQNILIRHRNYIYVETGIWRGDSLAQALSAGFPRVIGIDNDPESIEFCKNRFHTYGHLHPNLTLIPGNSAKCLGPLLETFDKGDRATIFLDAHWQFLEGTEKGEYPFPLLMELAQIKQSGCKNHTIIIDDWHIFYKDRVGFSKEDILQRLRDINPAYKIIMVANPVIDNLVIACP
jgi:hypothetical protein